MICDTGLNFYPENEPASTRRAAHSISLAVTCATAPVSTRDGLLTRRHVTAQVKRDAQPLPDWDGPTVNVTGHHNWWGYWPVPGSDGDGIQTNHGVDIKISGPGIGSGFMPAARSFPTAPPMAT